MKTVNDLRNILAEELVKLREGKATAKDVNAIANVASKILHSVKLELDYCKMTRQTPNIAFITANQTPAIVSNQQG